MSDHVVESFEVNGLTVEIVHMDGDDGVGSPRDADNLGVMVATGHSRHTLGDEPHRANIAEYGRAAQALDEDPRAFVDWVKADLGATVVLPLWLLDHSGLSMRTTGFAEDPGQWDSGVVGFIFDTPRTREMTGVQLESIEAQLTSEVQQYDLYLQGEVYGYRVLDPDGNELDSCWGFLGLDQYVRDEARAGANAQDVSAAGTIAAGAQDPAHVDAPQAALTQIADLPLADPDDVLHHLTAAAAGKLHGRPLSEAQAEHIKDRLARALTAAIDELSGDIAERMVTAVDLPDGYLRIWEPGVLQNTLGRMYVLDVLGVVTHIREREDGTYMQIDRAADSEVTDHPDLLVEVNDGGEMDFGPPATRPPSPEQSGSLTLAGTQDPHPSPAGARSLPGEPDPGPAPPAPISTAGARTPDRPAREGARGPRPPTVADAGGHRDRPPRLGPTGPGGPAARR
jgi:hypothetical protein